MLNSRCENLSTYNQTLVDEKSELTKLLSDAEQKISGSESWTHVQQLEQELRELQELSQEQVGGVWHLNSGVEYYTYSKMWKRRLT